MLRLLVLGAVVPRAPHAPNRSVWAKYGKEPFWPAEVEYDRNGEVKVRFLGVPEKSGSVAKELVVLFEEGYRRGLARRCQRGDFVMAVRLCLTRLGGDNALPGAARFFGRAKVAPPRDVTTPITVDNLREGW